MGVSSSAARMSRTSSSPGSPGSMRSHTTTSKRSPRCRALSSTSRASVPENACVHAYPARPRCSATISLMSASSSTMSTLAWSMGFPHLHRHLGRQPRSQPTAATPAVAAASTANSAPTASHGPNRHLSRQPQPRPQYSETRRLPGARCQPIASSTASSILATYMVSSPICAIWLRYF